MAKKSVAPKARKKKTTGKSAQSLQLWRLFSGLALLLLLVVAAGVLAYLFVKQPLEPSAVKIPPAVQKAPPLKAPQKPTYEVFPQKAVPDKPVDKLTPLPGDRPPIVAIIVDDIGYDRRMASRLLKLDAPLTFAMLPYSPFSRQVLDSARAKGHEIMLHLPMEPSEYPDVDPGPGALLTDMSPDEIIAQVEADIEQFPGLKGVNNHMGSRLSTSPERMRQIFSILKKHGLYYVDSRTTAETVARGSARLLQVPFAERDIFIDHFDDPAFIRGQLEKLIKRAQQQGYAIGIAHPYRNTCQALEDFLPRLKEAVELVPASMVVQSAMVADARKNGLRDDRFVVKTK